jgi:hypothetical protein
MVEARRPHPTQKLSAAESCYHIPKRTYLNKKTAAHNAARHARRRDSKRQRAWRSCARPAVACLDVARDPERSRLMKVQGVIVTLTVKAPEV